MTKAANSMAVRAVAVAAAATLVVAGSMRAHAKDATPADVRAGESIALGLCSTCHVVASNQPAAPVLTHPPKSFQQIADDPATTTANVRRFITTTHWDYHSLPMTMPDPNLLDDEADQVSAYILSLRKATAPSPAPPARLTRSDRQLEAGEYVALKLCSYCHVVSSDARYRPTLDQKTPSFQEIANDPKTTAASLRRFITATHWDDKTIPMTMPSQSLETDDAANVARYIMSLRQSR
jgi:mono/diheme cytochrome c family protein